MLALSRSHHGEVHTHRDPGGGGGGGERVREEVGVKELHFDMA